MPMPYRGTNACKVSRFRNSSPDLGKREVKLFRGSKNDAENCQRGGKE